MLMTMRPYKVKTHAEQVEPDGTTKGKWFRGYIDCNETQLPWKWSWTLWKDSKGNEPRSSNTASARMVRSGLPQICKDKFMGTFRSEAFKMSPSIHFVWGKRRRPQREPTRIPHSTNGKSADKSISSSPWIDSSAPVKVTPVMIILLSLIR